MGNYKFKLSDMIPNWWFYKVKDNMSKSSSSSKNSSKKKKVNINILSQSSPPPIYNHNHNHNHNQKSNPRKSYYQTRDFPSPGNSIAVDPPRKSSKQRLTVTKNRKSSSCSSSSSSPSINMSISKQSSVHSGCNNLNKTDDHQLEFRSDHVLVGCRCREEINSYYSPNNINDDEDNIVIKVDEKSMSSNSGYELPPIITKKTKQLVVVGVRKSFSNNSNSNTTGVKLRVNSPRIIRYGQGQGQRQGQRQGRTKASASASASASTSTSISTSTSTSKLRRRNSSSSSSSFAVVKCSYDPHRDFKESMLEMIVHNNIRASKDLEDLLACYLSLNSHQYHHLIIQVFKQIWFDKITHITFHNTSNSLN
ncbi:hypothetical protein ACFE04_003145 [Oxalis oulophora]